MKKSNIHIKANVMIDDDEHKHEIEYVPGDLLYLIDRMRLDKRTIDDGNVHNRATLLQIEEYLETILCLNCKMPCAGTCDP